MLLLIVIAIIFFHIGYPVQLAEAASGNHIRHPDFVHRRVPNLLPVWAEFRSGRFCRIHIAVRHHGKRQHLHPERVQRHPQTIPALDERRAYTKAWNVKIIPIFLTVVSTVLGFIPFMIGEEKEGFWFPLAAGTIGGLVMSVVGIFFYLPIFSLKKVRKGIPRRI